MPLTEEQRLRMEQKKAEALAKMKSRQAMISNSKPNPQTFHNISSPAAKAPFVPPRIQDSASTVHSKKPQQITSQFVPPKPAAISNSLNPQFVPDSSSSKSSNPSFSNSSNRPFVPVSSSSNHSKPNFSNKSAPIPINSTSSNSSNQPFSVSKPASIPSNPSNQTQNLNLSKAPIPSNSSFPNPSNPISGVKPSSVSSSGLTEEQKKVMENKRLAALAKKQSHTQVSNVINNKPSNPSNLSNAQSFYKPSENPPKPPPNQTKYLSNISQNKPPPSSNNNFVPNRVKGVLTLITKDRFEVQVAYHETLIKLFKSLKSSSYNAKTRIWNFAITDHDALLQAAASLRPDVDLTALPRWILETFKKPKPDLEQDISSIEPLIYESLMPFQHEGIKYGISRNGRVLIADDMGLGKTVQALGLASYYRDTWPFLIVSPSSMRFPWKTAIERWLPSIHVQQVQVILTGKDVIGSSEHLVTIISYDLLTKKLQELQKNNYQLIIMDESHCLKNDKSARTKAAEPLMKSCRNLILLSGTPALSRPMELYPQISALQPRLFRYVTEYGMRYCDGKMKTIGTKEIPDYSGSSHMQELSLLLSERCMIRRLKSEVLHQLPEKRREMVLLDPGSVNCTSKIMKDKEKAAKKTDLGANERRGLLLEWYAATSQAKLNAVQGYVKDLAQSEKKFLCFCHHKVMIEGIKDMLENEKIDFMLIDGGVGSEARKKAVDRFQTVDSCRVALLSITAANAGITLTAAELVVFAEIYWNPGILCQAEDRTHRIGQTNSVMVQYLVAKGTADDELWPMIKRKLDVLNQAGLSKDNFENSDSRQLESKDQSRIQDFFKAEAEVELEDDDEFEKLWGSMEDATFRDMEDSTFREMEDATFRDMEGLEETDFDQDLPAKKMKLN